ncbi:hypothetical protein [Haloarcula sp. JP-L23]|uniref:DUF7509 family protein n=1 Tax=Haloarcula sp. JP-L23 TaxID=2716717 RepID=UPI00140EAF8B|nr:hypothetical protein G9465_08115 [Haloarcula sp. JP-L23]
MRARIKSSLGEVAYGDFLVYLMGPYTTFDVEKLVPDSVDPAAVSLPAARADDDELDEMMATLRRVQGRLRENPGVNAFLAVDPEIPLSEMDAASQSIAFARASNATLFVVPGLGDKLGVGMEVGSVLEDMDETDRERVLFAHEDAVSSAMIRSIGQRWDARVVSYADEDELIVAVRQFVADLMNRELYGDLPRKTTDDGA